MTDPAFSALALDAEKLAHDIALMPEAHHRFARTERIWTYRSYEGGEPAYLIDWKQSARSERILTRTPEPMPIRPVFLWSASLQPPEIETQALTLLMALGALLLKANRPVGWLDDAARLSRTQPILRSYFEDALTAPSAKERPLPAAEDLAGALLVLATDFSEAQTEKILAFAARENKGLLLDLSGLAPDAAGAGSGAAQLYRKASNLGWPILRHKPGAPLESALLGLYQEALEATV